MIDTAKLDGLERQLRNRHFDGLAPELIEVIGLARLVLAAQAAPGEVEADCAAYDRVIDIPMYTAERRWTAMADALAAASLHRPVEARVTEGLDALTRPEPGSDEEAERAIRNSIARRPLPAAAELQAILDEPASLPIPQVTRGEVEAVVDHEIGRLHPHRADLVSGILSLFDGRARP